MLREKAETYVDIITTFCFQELSIVSVLHVLTSAGS